MPASTVTTMRYWEKIKQRASQLKVETYMLYLAARDKRTPWYAKLVVAAIVALALSPIDLIPDFIPVIGYLDDLILLPLAYALVIKLIPQSVLDDCRARALLAMDAKLPVSWTAGIMIILLWITLTVIFGKWFYDAVIESNTAD